MANNQKKVLKWKFELNGYFESKPLVDNNLVYMVCDEGNIYAVDIQTGKEKWVRKSREHYITTGTNLYNPEGGVICFSAYRTLFAIDSTTGEEKWKFETDDYISSTAITKEGVVYFCDKKFLYAVDILTGEEKWRLNNEGCDMGPNNTPIISESVIYFGCYDNHLYAVDTKTGKLKWRRWIPYLNLEIRISSSMTSSPIISEGIIYFGCYNHSLYAADLNVQSLDNKNGWSDRLQISAEKKAKKLKELITVSTEEAQKNLEDKGDIDKMVEKYEWPSREDFIENWRKRMEEFKKSIHQTPFQTQQYHAETIGISDEKLTELLSQGATAFKTLTDASPSIKVKWQFNIGSNKEFKFDGKDFITGTPLVAEGMVFFGSNNKHFYALDTKTGKEIWKFKTGGKIYSSPVVSDSLIYFSSDDYYLYAVDIKTGKLKFKIGIIDDESHYLSSPVISKSRIYFASHNSTSSYLYAVDIKSARESRLEKILVS